ncbi:MAG: CDP-diacylglycerol--glycerol-3-phosphate 3-phosphatidyltransferase [Candidatus Eisenbacteria bacterium]|nr:CDP-diacylglycerol--glycerol-3-phosphate 3-phosphatidyltransferase [Candidatus Eisenbacteria bacterium]
MAMNLPNGLTVARLFLGPVVLACLLAGQIAASFYVFLVAMVTDLYDGYLARRSHSVTEFGKLMDPLADKVLVSLSLIGFVLLGVPFVGIWMAAAIIGRELLILGWRTGAVKSGGGFVTSRMAKWKTASQMAWVALVLLYLTVLSYAGVEPAAAGGGPGATVLWVLGTGTVILTLVSGAEYILNGRHRTEPASS